MEIAPEHAEADPMDRAGEGLDIERATMKVLNDRALGRSVGGWTTKLHLWCDGQGRPMGFTVSAGQRQEGPLMEGPLDATRVPRPGRGRPRKRPESITLDKGYSSRRCRRALRKRGIGSMIPERQDQRANRQKKGRKGGRPVVYDKERYRLRSWVERCFNRLKQWRRIATRYDKRAESYLTWVTLASILLWSPS